MTQREEWCIHFKMVHEDSLCGEYNGMYMVILVIYGHIVLFVVIILGCSKFIFVYFVGHWELYQETLLFFAHKNIISSVKLFAHPQEKH